MMTATCVSGGMRMQAALDKLVGALQDFYARETHLLERDLGERALTHRLAVSLEGHFPEWNIDCDYNRLGADLAASESEHRQHRR